MRIAKEIVLIPKLLSTYLLPSLQNSGNLGFKRKAIKHDIFT